TWIGFDTLIDPSYPHSAVIGNRVAIEIRVLILAHFAHHGRNRESGGGGIDDRVSVRIENDVFIGLSALIVPEPRTRPRGQTRGRRRPTRRRRHGPRGDSAPWTTGVRRPHVHRPQLTLHRAIR